MSPAPVAPRCARSHCAVGRGPRHALRRHPLGVRAQGERGAVRRLLRWVGAQWVGRPVGGGAVRGSPRGRGRSACVPPWAGAQCVGRSVGTGVVGGSLRGHGRSGRAASLGVCAVRGSRGVGVGPRWGCPVASRRLRGVSLGPSAMGRSPPCAVSQCAAVRRGPPPIALPRVRRLRSGERLQWGAAQRACAAKRRRARTRTRDLQLPSLRL